MNAAEIKLDLFRKIDQLKDIKLLKMMKTPLIIFACLINTLSCHLVNKSAQEDTSFNQFFEHFSRDSVFQSSRILFPLTWQSIDDEGNMDKIMIKKSEWTYIDFSHDTIAYKHETDKYKPVIENLGKDTVNYIRDGIDNGIHIEYTFTKFENKWVLSKVYDKSN
jgi:hypothetical protein